MDEQLYMELAKVIMYWGGQLLGVLIALYIAIRMNNTAKRRVGKTNYVSSPLAEGVMMRFPTATGSEVAIISGANNTHIKIVYSNGDIGGLSLMDFDKANYRIVPKRKDDDAIGQLEKAVAEVLESTTRIDEKIKSQV